MSFYGKLTRHVALFFQSGEAHKDGGTKQKNEGSKQEIKDPNKKLRRQTKK